MTVTAGQATPGEPALARGAPRYRWLGISLLALGIGIAVNSLLGPLFAEVIDYPLTETLRHQTRGLEAFSLAVIAPWSLVAGVLALRGHRGAPVLALAPALYAGYMFVQYLIGPNYEYYPAVFPLHLAIFILACAVALTAWSSVERIRLPPVSRRRERGLSVFLLFLAAFVLFRYVPVLVDAIAGESLPPEAVEEPAMFWSIVWLDLGVVVPATIATAIALLRRAPWARTALYAIVGWFALVPPSVAAMAIVMLINDDPNTTSGDVLVLSVAALTFGAVAAWLYRPLFARPTTTTTPWPALPRVECALVGLEVALALGAYSGGLGLLTGLVDLGESAEHLPWQSLYLAGTALIVINGLLPTAVAIGALLRKPWARPGHLAVGTALIGWVVVQVAFIGLGSWLQVAYLAYGLVILALALHLYRGR